MARVVVRSIEAVCLRAFVVATARFGVAGLPLVAAGVGAGMETLVISGLSPSAGRATWVYLVW
jgi:hypothetical protein